MICCKNACASESSAWSSHEAAHSPCTLLLSYSLRRSKAVEIPVYSFTEHQRTSEKTYVYGATVLIVEGIL